MQNLHNLKPFLSGIWGTNRNCQQQHWIENGVMIAHNYGIFARGPMLRPLFDQDKCAACKEYVARRTTR